MWFWLMTHLIWQCIFLINRTIIQVIVTFHWTYSWSLISSVLVFSIMGFAWSDFAFFFMMCSNNFYKIKFFYYICSWYRVFNFFNDKKHAWIFLLFWYQHKILNFKFGIFIIIFNIKVDIGTHLNINDVICIALWCSMICVILYFLTTLCNPSMYTFVILRS